MEYHINCWKKFKVAFSDKNDKVRSEDEKCMQICSLFCSTELYLVRVCVCVFILIYRIFCKICVLLLTVLVRFVEL